MAGTLLTATVKGTAGFLPTIELRDETTVQTLDVTAALKGAGTSTVTIKAFPLPSSGDYTVLIGPATGQTGAYKLTTKGTIGKALKSFKVDGATAPGGGAVNFGGLVNATLTATVKPDKNSGVTPDVPTLTGPNGDVNLGSATTLTTGKVPTAKVTGLVLDATGNYVFTPVLAADSAEPVTTTLKLVFPKVKKTTHIEHPTFVNADTQLVSQNTVGTQGAEESIDAACDFDGQRIAFLSNSVNLVAGCGGGTIVSPVFDVFVRDLEQGTTVSVSAPTGSTDGQGGCGGLAIDALGDIVAFGSTAAGLVPATRTATSTSSSAISGRRRRRAFRSPPAEPRPTAPTRPTSSPAASRSASRATGNLVAFESDATDLVTGDGNGVTDIFVHDVNADTTTRVSTTAAGAQGNAGSTQAAISLDGKRVAFTSAATNLVSGDSNGKLDVYVKVLATGAVLRVSLMADGTQLASDSNEPTISGDGRFVAFISQGAFVVGDANNKADVFVKDLQSGAVDIASVGNGGTSGNSHAALPHISASGQQVLFRSLATNILNGTDNNGAANGDVFLRDRPSGTTVRVSLGALGEFANGDCYAGDLSGDGSHAAFFGLATNLVQDQRSEQRVGRLGALLAGAGGPPGNGWPRSRLRRSRPRASRATAGGTVCKARLSDPPTRGRHTAASVSATLSKSTGRCFCIRSRAASRAMSLSETRPTSRPSRSITGRRRTCCSCISRSARATGSSGPMPCRLPDIAERTCMSASARPCV